MKISNTYATRHWFEVMQTTERSQTAVMTLEANGQSSEEMNTHKNSDQVLLVLHGEVSAEIGGKTHVMRVGDVCIVPAGTPHRFENQSKDRAVTFNVYSPPEYPSDEKG